MKTTSKELFLDKWTFTLAPCQVNEFMFKQKLMGWHQLFCSKP